MSNQAKKIPFRVSARTARLIGRENVANAEAAVIELIKNSYDADATKSEIIIQDGHLYIADNGLGMSEETIIDKWMVIGTDNKDVDPITAGKRVKSGAKGIGRFALDKLGGDVEMYTLTEEGQARRWSIDWGLFNEKDRTVSEVGATLETIAIVDFKHAVKKAGLEDRTTGTIFRIGKLNDVWSKERLDRLYRALQSLVPIIEEDTFAIRLHSSDFPDKYGLVDPLITHDYDYRLNAIFDASDLTVQYEIARNEFSSKFNSANYKGLLSEKGMGNFPFSEDSLFMDSYEKKISATELLKGYDNVSELEKIGSFSFQIYFAKNREPNKEDREKYPYRPVDYQKRMEWLKLFDGVRIYRDNFRVRPYGENGDDWLRLGERQAQSPQGAGQRLGAFRVRPNQITGSVHLSRLANLHLVDKSSREGIVENSSFALLRNIVVRLIGLLEKDRNQIFYSLNQVHQKTNEKAKKKSEGKRAAENIKDGSSHNEDGKKAADYIEILEEENKDKDEEIKILRSLASAGLVTAAAAHELKGFEHYLKLRSGQLKTILQKYVGEEQLEGVRSANNPYTRIEEMAEVDSKIIGWLNYALMPLKRDKRTRRTFSLSVYLKELTEVWQPILSSRDISISTNIVTECRVRLYPIDLDTVFNNLIINSIEAFGRYGGKRNISVKIEQQGGSVAMTYSDTGPGLHESFVNSPEEIFLPHTTTKVDSDGKAIGTGMGMYLLHTVVDDNDGEVILERTAHGFQIKIILEAR